MLRASSSSRLLPSIWKLELPSHQMRRYGQSLRDFEHGDVKAFRKILVANRGEIACRVIRSAQEQGIRAVAVYSEADRNAMHVSMADEAYCIGPAPASESYLVAEKLLDVARKSEAQAVHPGYGFLSENADFADQCEKEGLVFIGPPSSAIRSMGSKSASKNIMESANVPCVPGYHGEDQSRERLRSEAEKIGYPLLIKAVLGGGGKGMRIVHSASELDTAIDAAQREAKASFGDDRVLVEKYLERPRHVEIQVFADTHGNVVYLFERDCSLQRRYQKVIEEAPAPGLTEEHRRKIGDTAVAAARAVGYVGAGTVEFIMDANDGSFYFMEMNTRLQVEHPVTEMVTKEDLVKWQLHVAAGGTLPRVQEELELSGHAFEARIYAENPLNNFMPGSGRVQSLEVPEESQHVRIDTGIRTGDDVSVFYDPMIAKLIVWDQNRDSALRRMRVALDNFNVAGLPTNVEFLKRCCDHPSFIDGDVETHFISQHEADLLPSAEPTPTEGVAAAALFLTLEAHQKRSQSIRRTGENFDSSSQHRFRMNLSSRQLIELIDADGSLVRAEVEFFPHDCSYGIRVVERAGEPVDAQPVRVSGHYDDATNRLDAQVGDIRVSTSVSFDDHSHTLSLFEKGGATWSFSLPVHEFSETEGGSQGSLYAPMPGKITKLLVQEGDAVELGQALIIMEAMKMEHTISANASGTVRSLNCAVDNVVDEKTPLVSIDTEQEEGDQ